MFTRSTSTQLLVYYLFYFFTYQRHTHAVKKNTQPKWRKNVNLNCKRKSTSHQNENVFFCHGDSNHNHIHRNALLHSSHLVWCLLQSINQSINQLANQLAINRPVGWNLKVSFVFFWNQLPDVELAYVGHLQQRVAKNRLCCVLSVVLQWMSKKLWQKLGGFSFWTTQ